ncbi:hypothetical protein EYF80_022972 [Liparis tanakae]|uniref:Uncharacterized protein n=1 Tax=Liparis tanakae TaxID=230148 RepID=A0A4Z2HMC8_9TELE|nr:hypothetical protein EYF80_022972 [Liparis tanakae]
MENETLSPEYDVDPAAGARSRPLSAVRTPAFKSVANNGPHRARRWVAMDPTEKKRKGVEIAFCFFL